MIGLLLAISMGFAKAEPVFLIDTSQWTIRHCNCIHLPDYHEYCSDGWDWGLYSNWQIKESAKEAREALKAAKEREIERLRKMDLDAIGVLEQSQ